MSKTVCLYIEDTEIKLLVAKADHIEHSASQILEPGLVTDGMIHDEAKVAESIQQLFKLQNIRGSGVTLGISGLNSVFRIISIPNVSKQLVPEAISNEASRVLPMPMSQVYFSYQIIDSTKDEIKLFLAAYPRISTDLLLNTIKRAGLKPDKLDLAPLALARCVDANRAILVNTWLTSVDIIVMDERIPVVVRSLSLAVDDPSLKERISIVEEELSRTIAFYNNTYPDKPLESSTGIFLSGDIAREDENIKELGKLGFPVSQLHPQLSYGPEFDPANYMVNIGLAFKGQKSGSRDQSSKIDFNAIPQSYQQPPFRWSNVLLPVAGVVAIASLGYGNLQLTNLRSDNDLLNRQYAQLTAQIASQTTENTKIQNAIVQANIEGDALSASAEETQTQIDNVQKSQAFLDGTMKGFKTGLDSSSTDSKEILKDVPSGLFLTIIQYRDDIISLKGVSPNQTLILTYAKSLRSSGNFNSVSITTIEMTDSGELNFEISLS
jgi:type IV pilus assembly protein PilM